MSGRDFVAVVRLTCPNRGEEIDPRTGKPSILSWTTLAEPGETCERVPAASLEWLERSGKIKRASGELPGEALPDFPRGRRVKPPTKEGA